MGRYHPMPWPTVSIFIVAVNDDTGGSASSVG
jgi:hypothetical protein